MIARVVRQLAADHSAVTLADAIDAMTEEEREILEVEGADGGERLTHLLLAARVRDQMDAGETLKTAFRSVMASVREVMTND